MIGAILFYNCYVYCTSNILSHYKLLQELKAKENNYATAVKDCKYIRIMQFKNQLGIELFEDLENLECSIKLKLYEVCLKLQNENLCKINNIVVENVSKSTTMTLKSILELL